MIDTVIAFSRVKSRKAIKLLNQPKRLHHACKMAIASVLDRMCLALRASGLWLRYPALQNLIPSFPWIVPPTLHPSPIQGMEGIKFCHLATMTGRRGREIENGVTCQIQWRMRMRLSEWHLRRRAFVNTRWMRFPNNLVVSIALVSSFANISLALKPPLSRPLRRAAIAWPMRGLRLAAGFHFQGKEQADRILQVIKVLFIRRKIIG